MNLEKKEIPNSLEEQRLIRKAQKGDSRAFEALVRKYDRRILGIALHMTGNAEDAQDIYQEVLLAIFKGLSRFRMESTFFTWMFRVTVNKALQFRRKQKSPVLIRKKAWSGESETEKADYTTPEKIAIRREMEQMLLGALDTLSEKERMAFVLCHRQGCRISEGAELMGCSSGAVKSYLFRARQKIRLALQTNVDEYGV